MEVCGEGVLGSALPHALSFKDSIWVDIDCFQNGSCVTMMGNEPETIIGLEVLPFSHNKKFEASPFEIFF